MPDSGIVGGITQIVIVPSDKRGTHHDTSLDIGQALGTIKMNMISEDALVVYVYRLGINAIQLI